MALGIAQTEQGIINTSTNQYAPAFAASQANAGIGATGAFVRTFQIAPHTTAQGDAAVNIMRGKAGALEGAGRGTGSAGARGFGSGIAPMPETARRTTQSAADSVRNVDGFGPGSSVGKSIVDGMTSGVSASAGALAGAAGQAVRDALAHAKGLINARSPSKVFAREVGEPISQGIAVGITAEAPKVNAALDDVLAVPDVPLARVRPFGGAAGGAAAGVGNTFVTVAAGAVVVNLPAGSTAADQQRILRDAGAAFWGTMADRRVTAGAAAR
jgi:hypothetical protein